MNVIDKQKDTRRCTRHVWFLALTGLSSGCIMLLIVGWSLAGIRADRIKRDESFKRVTGLQNTVNSWVLDSMDSAKWLLDGGDVAPSLYLHDDLQEVLQQTQAMGTAVETAALTECLREFDQFLRRCEQFSNAMQRCDKQRGDLRTKTASALRDLRAAIQSRSGMRKLNLAVNIRKYRGLTGDEANLFASKLLKEWLPRGGLTAVERELSDCALLCERLYNESASDSLIDLKDNQFHSAIQRLRRELSKESFHDTEIAHRVDEFEAVLFGKGYRMNRKLQQIVPGEAGFYSSCAEWLAMLSQRQQLEAEATTRFDQLRYQQNRLSNRTTELTNLLAQNVAKSMATAWSNMALTATLCSIPFLILANRIASTLAAQISAINHQASALEVEIQERALAEKDRERLHRELQASARSSGMAEVATGVLHNVGNVLNSVNTSIGILRSNCRSRATDTLRRAVSLLGEHDGDLRAFVEHDKKANQLFPLMQQVVCRLEKDRTSLRDEIESLASNVEHIKSIVRMQQSFAKYVGTKELTRVVDLVEDALHMNSVSLKRHHIQVVRDFQLLKEIALDKHQVLQILINLIKNAIDAMKLVDREPKCLRLAIYREHEFVRVDIEDNGIGISEETLPKIFRHRFTTKEAGHGFGLHSCANAARKAGGSLSVRSPGVDQGATFTLLLPETKLSGEPEVLDAQASGIR